MVPAAAAVAAVAAAAVEAIAEEVMTAAAVEGIDINFSPSSGV